MNQAYWVMPGVLAGRPSPELVPWTTKEMMTAGIGGVISLDGPIRARPLLAVGIEHLAVYRPMLLLRTRMEQERFNTVMRTILPFVDRIRSMNKATLVHCYYGCDRTGAALANYLIAREGMSAEAAITKIQRINPDALWAPGYMEAVHTFEEMYRADPGLFENLGSS